MRAECTVSRTPTIIVGLAVIAALVAPLSAQSDFCFSDVVGDRNWRTMAQEFAFPDQTEGAGGPILDILIYAFIIAQPEIVTDVQLTVIGDSFTTQPFTDPMATATITAALISQGLLNPLTETAYLFSSTGPAFIAPGSAVQQRIMIAGGAPGAGDLSGASICMEQVMSGNPLVFPAALTDDLSISIFPQVLITEVCADPFGGLGGLDNNLDGVAATLAAGADDEFIEIVNALDVAVNLGGWTLSDATATRHTFAPGTTLGPGRAIVVFGGGCAASYNSTPSGFGRIGVVASSGSLGLGDVTDTITLRDSMMNTIDTAAYNQVADGESLTRDPEIPGGAFVPIGTVTPGVRATPGNRSNGTIPYFPGTLPTAFPGNGSDCAIGVAVDGFFTAATNGIHAVPAGSVLSLVLDSPGGTLAGRRLLCFGQLHASSTSIPLLTIGTNLAVYFSLSLGSAITIADGFDVLATFPPSLAPFIFTTVVPVSVVGQSLLVNMLVNDPGINPFSLGVAEAQELVFK